MILVTGASGKVGNAVTRKLILSNRPFRVMLRDPRKGKLIPSGNVQSIIGDFEKPATLSLAFQGVKKLFLVSDPSAEQVKLHANVFNAAKKAGVTHIVRVSAFGASANSPVTFFKLHAQSEQELQGSGIPFTHIRPSYFYQNFENFAPTIAKERAFYAPVKAAPVSMVDIRDVASVICSVLTEDGHENKSYDVTGPQALTFQDAANHFTSFYNGPTVKYNDLPPEKWAAAMTEVGMTPWLTNSLSELYTHMAAGKFTGVTPVVQQVTKQPARPFKGFAEEFIRVLKEAESLRLGRGSR
ncbi:MAG: SDR family oxidoreductase [Bdellovibrionia bacterium]